MSSYRVLARKYRPRTFAEVIGQDHVVKALSRALERERLGQAYVFVGPRGVGKTSSARILAKSLNCEKGPTLEPCLECAACKEIEVGADVDVIEIDGASNNGVDDVRAIRDHVHYRPLRDRRKIYIIDEVQRLSGPAFDALLKTLEEPPGHALFIFATTDPHKIPETITSRCQSFEFRRLREVDILAKLKHVCESESVSVPEEVLAALARGCRGGMRDAESMLDQVLAVAEGEPSLDDLEMIAGLARPERWLDVFEAVARDDAPAILRSVEEFLQRGGTERDFTEQAVDALRDLLHVALLGEDALAVEPAPERRERMMALARELGRDRLETLIGMFFSLDARMTSAPLASRALLEWTLLRAARLGMLLDAGALLSALQGGEGLPPATASEPKSRLRAANAPKSKPSPGGGPPDSAPGMSRPAKPPARIEDLLERVTKARPTLGAVIQQNLLSADVGGDGVHLVLREVTGPDKDMLTDPHELSFLGKLPGSPGPWQIDFRDRMETPSDPMAGKLKEAFGGSEEVP